MTDFQEQLIFLGRIALAGALGQLVGWERESSGSPAGNRTHALVAIAAAGFAALGTGLAPDGTSRIIQGIVTGVGFLGAGMILQQGGKVRGLTTAAGMWVVASIGVMVGLGDYVLGVAVAGVTLLVLIEKKVPWLRRLNRTKRNPRPSPLGQLGSSAPHAAS